MSEKSRAQEPKLIEALMKVIAKDKNWKKLESAGYTITITK